MKTLFRKFWEEPTAFLGALNAILNVVQVAAIDMPTWAHALVAVVLAATSHAVVRQTVTPYYSGEPITDGPATDDSLNPDAPPE